MFPEEKYSTINHPLYRTARRLATAAVLVLGGATSAFATTPISLPDAKYFPEGVTIDDKGGLYVGSLTEGRIVYIDPFNHAVRSFVASGTNGLVSVLGILIDQDGNTLYACSSDPGISELTGSAKPAIVTFDTSTGAPGDRFELPEGGFCNDLTQMPDGTILATDSLNARIYALDPAGNALKIWLSDQRFTGEGFGLNGIASTADAVYVVKYNSGQLFEISVSANGAPSGVNEIKLDRPLAGPDGLEAIGKNELLVVEGGGLKAGSRGNLSKITLTSESGVVQTLTTDLNVPTTAAIGDGIAFVVEGQLDHLFDPEAGPPDEFQILEIEFN